MARVAFRVYNSVGPLCILMAKISNIMDSFALPMMIGLEFSLHSYLRKPTGATGTSVSFKTARDKFQVFLYFVVPSAMHTLF